MAVAVSRGKGSSAPEQRLPPSQSLYFQNLPEKLQKEDLRRALYILLSTYGPVLDVTALKTKRMRGQAHALFRDVQSATQAMRSLQGMDFFGRELKISYAKNRSHTLAKLTGTFQPTGTTEQSSKQTAAPPSSFPAPPGAAPPSKLPGPPSGLPPPPGLPAKPNGSAGLRAPPSGPQDAASPQGVKRQREESDGEDEAMDEDEDDEGAMDMSDDDD